MLLFIFLTISNWLQNHLIPCPFKRLTGVDCPGCGFQRSIIALVRGNFNESFHLYPAAIPLLLTTGFVIVAIKCNIDNRHIIKKVLYIITGSIIMISYIYKMYNLYA